ncbi:MAG: SIMPL domain-containing protein [Gaiella sp.]|nr:SIMPL domain-containing protein [Gaiella sp.]
MKRIALAAALLLAAAALAGVLRPEGAGADTTTPGTDSVTVTGTGGVEAVPDRAEISAGVESRAPTAQGALAANGAAMRKVIAALREGGGKDVTTQSVSLATTFDQNGKPDGFVASNIASAETLLADAGALIDAAVAAGATTIYGPSLSSSDAHALYRQALAKAVDDAKARAGILASAAGRELGRVTAIVEGGGAPVPFAAKASGTQDSTPVVSGPQETTAQVSVTYELR